MMQLHLSDSPLVAVVNDAEVANVAAVAFISHVTLVNDAGFAIVMLLQLKLSMLLQLKCSTYMLLQLKFSTYMLLQLQ